MRQAVEDRWFWPGMVLVALVLLGIVSCQPLTQAASTVCGDIARMPVAASAALDAQDPHSALGVLWADVKSGCAVGAPVVGVDQSWTGMVWGEMKVLIPQVLPSLLPILVGLL